MSGKSTERDHEGGDLHEYPERAELISSMAPIFKSARGEVPPEMEGVGVDRKGWRHLRRLQERLLRHVYFEHLGRQAISGKLREAVLCYRGTAPTARHNWKEAAAQTLDPMAQEPLRRTVLLGLEHLSLPNDTQVGEVRFIDPSTDPELVVALSRFGGEPHTLVGEVQAVAGTVELLRERARDTVETVLSLLRQQTMFGMRAVKIYRMQVMFGLTGVWAIKDGDAWQSGWWREKQTPVPADLAHPNMSEWRVRLDELASLRGRLAPEIRSRVDTCLGWLNVAALSEDWRVVIPAVFSGMESLLAPEKSGLKAGIVTVRSLAVHAALDHGFYNPGQIVSAYELRSDLVHGTPTPAVLTADVTEFADDRCRWAFEVLSDYLELVTNIGATTVADVVRYLDEGKCNDVCDWLEAAFGGEDVVGEYRRVVAALRGGRGAGGELATDNDGLATQ